MPYADEFVGVYALTNRDRGVVYIGQSRRVKKRTSDHFNLLRRGVHPNSRLQNSFNKYGPQAWSVEIIATCDDPVDLDSVEGAFLSGDASYDGLAMLNIAIHPTSGMLGRKHSPETKALMSRNRTGKRGHVTPEYRAKIKAASLRRHLSNATFVSRVKTIIAMVKAGIPHSDVAKLTNTDVSSTYKLYKKYKDFDL